MLTNDCLRYIANFVDDYTYLKLCHCCGIFPRERYKNILIKLATEKYHKIKNTPIYTPYYHSDECLPADIVSRINKGTANIWDYLHMKAMLKATQDHIDCLEEWDNDYFQRDISAVRSFVQGVRISLHLRGFDIPDDPEFSECPKDVRCKAIDGRLLKAYMESKVIRGRIRNLRNRYKNTFCPVFIDLFTKREQLYYIPNDSEYW